MAILILSHLFLYYFILTKLYFISILPDKENRASILFEFYFYFNPILKQDWTRWGILFLFFHNKLKNSLYNRLF